MPIRRCCSNLRSNSIPHSTPSSLPAWHKPRATPWCLWGGKDHLLYAAKVAGTPWMLVVAAERADALASLTRLGQVAALSTLVCIVVAALVMGLTVRRMLAPLVTVRNALQDIASGEGDLTRRLQVHGRDELSDIGHAFNSFTEKIAAVLLRIRDAAESVRLATGEIASGNQDLSSRT